MAPRSAGAGPAHRRPLTPARRAPGPPLTTPLAHRRLLLALHLALSCVGLCRLIPAAWRNDVQWRARRQQLLLRYLALLQGPAHALGCFSPVLGGRRASLFFEHLAHHLAAIWLRLPLKRTLQLGAANGPLFAAAALHAAWRRAGPLAAAAEALAALLVPLAVASALQLAHAQQCARPRRPLTSLCSGGQPPLRRLALAADAAVAAAERRLHSLCGAAPPALLLALACYPCLALTCAKQVLLLAAPASAGLAASPFEVLAALGFTALLCSTEAGALQVGRRCRRAAATAALVRASCAVPLAERPRARASAARARADLPCPPPAPLPARRAPRSASWPPRAPSCTT
jgi:hypothetical protein